MDKDGDTGGKKQGHDPCSCGLSHDKQCLINMWLVIVISNSFILLNIKSTDDIIHNILYRVDQKS